jgi:hypothetical protein
MSSQIDLEQKTDGRWIAEFSDLEHDVTARE